jgi:mono/diheme cytochrome c family protein
VIRTALVPAALARSIFALALGALARTAFAAQPPPSEHALPASAHTDSAAHVHRVAGEFEKLISPILQQRCFDCHGDGSRKGGLAFDELTTPANLARNPELWLKVLRNTRSQVMPPPGEEPLTAAEQRTLEQWIVTGAFALDPAKPDPGRVTLRRLSRTEYRNTLRDLIGADFDAEAMLPPDDVGYGFDNIGDVMSISPMRMEKFIEAAMAAVHQAVPMDTVVMSTKMLVGGDFVSADGTQNAEKYSYYQARTTSHTFKITTAGQYRLMINTKLDGEASPVDPQRCRVVWKADGKVILDKEYGWADMEYLTDTFTFDWAPGDHVVSCELTPVFPELKPLRTKMEYRVLFAIFDGPLEKEKWAHHPNYGRFYTREKPPETQAERRIYAREVLTRFVSKAYRRPVPANDPAVDQLVDIAEKSYSLPGTTFEKGVAQAIVAVLASPSFLFHREQTEPPVAGQQVARLDEYSLAARLSYALWSSLPDDELTQLAARGELRKNFAAQVKRMIADPKAKAFAENFAGQWLQSRGVVDISINSAVVMAAEAPPTPAGETVAAVAPPPPGPPAGFAPPGGPPRGNFAGRGGFGRRRPAPGTELTTDIRLAMKQEAEAYFHHIVREDRSVLELLHSNYTFVNEALAPVYGLADIRGAEMRRVELPADSVRGGVLTMGSVLTVTSNPTRTSPVKRGKWILENILGAPPAPPPPDIPSLEDAKPEGQEKSLTQRELLALHRENPACASCHARMDPLGLALEGFNAFGRTRTLDSGQPIDPSGEMATGEKFSGVRDLKQALVEKHRIEFYRTLTEKLLTYVLGRGVEYYDVPTVDAIVAQLDRDNGRFSTLLLGALESAPFQQRRLAPHSGSASEGVKTVSTFSAP